MSFFTELKRRNVIRVGIFYGVLSWLVLQVADVIFGVTQLPEWSLTLVGIILALGFIPVLAFAWAFELTPEGIKRETHIDRSSPRSHETARKLDIAVLVMLVVVAGLLLVDHAGTDEAAVTASRPGAARDAAETVSETNPVASVPSIAVLPFANLSADKENEYFADGISEEILNLLASVDDLSVASRTSAFSFRGKDTPIPEIATALDVRYVLEGSVRKAGEQVRVTAQLIDATTDRHLWSETFDRTLQDIFAIQDEIAAAIGDALQVELLGKSGAPVAKEEIDPEIYALFLEARHTMRLRGGENIRKATEMLIKVVEAEPDFARAHLLLGEAYLLANDQGASLVPTEIARAQAKMHAEIARRIDPDLAGIYLIMGSLAGSEGNLVKAVENYDQAIELEPSEPRPYHWRALLYRSAGYLQEALADALEAVRLEPGNAGARGALALTQVSLGDLDRAFANLDRMVELGHSFGHQMKGLIRLMEGEPGAAREHFDNLLEVADGPADWYQLLIEVANGGRSRADLMAAIDSGAHLQPDLGPAVSREQMLAALLAVGMHEEYLSQPLEQFSSFAFFLWGERFRSMRADPRFIRIMEHIGTTDLWQVRGPPPDCRRVGDSFTCGHGYPAGYAAEVSPTP